MGTDVQLPAACVLLDDLAEVCLCDSAYDFVRHTLTAKERKMYELREGQGSMFYGDEPSDDNHQPQFRGKLMVEGKVVYFAGWKKTAKSGQVYYSLSVDKPQVRCQVVEPPVETVVMDEDVPW